MRSSWSIARGATVIAAALGFSGSVLALDSATTQSTNRGSDNEQYKSAANQAKVDYKVAWSKCQDMTGTERMQCRKDAKATQQRVMNDAKSNRQSANDATWATGNAGNISSDPSKGNATRSSQGGTVGVQGYTGANSETNRPGSITGSMGERSTGDNATTVNGTGSVSNDSRTNTSRDAPSKMDPNNDHRGTPMGGAPR